jgi:hypothetical protein
MAVVSEVLECFGGAGYVEDTGLPMLCATARCSRSGRTTNVLSLDALRAVGSGAALEAFTAGAQSRPSARNTRLAEPAKRAAEGVASAANWLSPLPLEVRMLSNPARAASPHARPLTRLALSGTALGADTNTTSGRSPPRFGSRARGRWGRSGR